MKVFIAHFETEYGMETFRAVVRNIKEATAELKKYNPHDHGADGYWEQEDGTELPIDW